MTPELGFKERNFQARAVSPFREMGAYEALWSEGRVSFKSLSARFARHPDSLPSHFVPEERALHCATQVKRKMAEAEVHGFGVRVHGAGEYPDKLRDAAHPLALLYYQGWWDLAESPSIAVVGTRKPTAEGLARTRRIVRDLVSDEFTVVSGLAAGIDRAAHETAVEENGRTIAVLGTPLSHAYPKEHRALQRHIAEYFLVVSQVPVIRYEAQDYRRNRGFFPERNATMSALTEATIIVEAGETSGTLTQARAALRQGRKLFVLDSCFRDPRLTWPARFAEQGAIRVRDYEDVRRHLPRRLTRIDALVRPDHWYLTGEDNCYFIGEYTARKGFAHSASNSLLLNFKKAMDRRGRPEWPHKGRAIRKAASAFRAALANGDLDQLTFVPVPPSRARGDPLYDDRLVRMLRAIRPAPPLDVRELVVQTASMIPAHERDDRPDPRAVEALYRIDGTLLEGCRPTIVVVDDMLTTGAHFRAAKSVIVQALPEATVIGLFLVRRVPDTVDPDEFDDRGP